MKDFVKWFDDAPWWLKIVLALPVIDIAWAVYRIIKGAAYGKVWLIVVGILWIIPFFEIAWLVDLICILVWKEPKLA